MKKEELHKLWEEVHPSAEEFKQWGKEVVVKGELLNGLINLLEFMVVLVGAVTQLIPASTRK